MPKDNILPGEPVDVVVYFKKNKFIPKYFAFNSDKHIIKKIQFTWCEKKGTQAFNIFSVTDENNTSFTLCFNRENLQWRILSENL
ncbi:MAG: hypothetical protein ABIG64_08420 [Candidatus Omnitrophota bacterium]